ncbi:M1 family aminopeptidase [Kribbella sp. GL6]|uniref:M1 family aminopeptidase n=1 Tax=Kribbella sp. GL6 TaxID=3419765 RepID=UPI003D0797B7
MPADGGLTAAEAAARSAVVSVTSYAITLDLTPLTTGDQFTSRTTVNFTYDGTGGPGLTWLDIVADHVDQVTLDGVPLDPSEALRNHRLRLGPLGGPHRLDIHSRHHTAPSRGLSKTVDTTPTPVPAPAPGGPAPAPGSGVGSAPIPVPGSGVAPAPAPGSGVGSDSGAGPSTRVRAAVGGADAGRDGGRGRGGAGVGAGGRGGGGRRGGAGVGAGGWAGGGARGGDVAGVTGAADRGDEGVYVWTQFQPFDARRVFACFDQPDLKATFAFEVRVPLGWQCVSNQRETEVVEDGDAAVWRFPPTPRLPTYATAVCAGPFHVVRSGRMAVFARRSLAAALEANVDELFDLSRRALALFEEAFGVAYDGDSYDHVFLPDQPGAMENHGCVTWNDQVLYRSEPTAEQRRRRALVLLHEMSHMWFGNLVTPQWWDGLWLSESFADWAALWAAAELGVLDRTWSVATALEKERAADADLLSSTHPVSRPIPDIATTEANFDAITYAKGAAVLRQLVSVVGEAAFFEGLRKYFAQNAGANGNLPALLAAVQPFTALDLTAWSRVWLESSGINTLSLENGALLQDGVIRPHTIAIARYGGTPLTELDRVELPVTDARTELPPAGSGLLLLDDRDTTYAILHPDAHSIRTLVTSGAELTDPVARYTARRTLRGLLLTGHLPAADIFTYVTAAVTTEPDPIHLKALTSLAAEATIYATPTQRPALEHDLATAVTSILDPSQPVLVEALADCAGTADQLALVDSLLTNADLPQPIRWRLTTRLVALGADNRIDAEETRDPDGHWQAAAARAAIPTTAAKTAALDLLLTAPGVPAAVLRTFGAALWHPRHDPNHATEFLDRLIPFAHTTDWFTAARVARYAFPTTADLPFLDAVREAAAGAPPVLAQALQDQEETARRAATARAT